MKKKLSIVAIILALAILCVFLAQSNTYKKTLKEINDPVIYLNSVVLDNKEDFSGYNASEEDITEYQNLLNHLTTASKEYLSQVKVVKETLIESSENILFGLEDGENIVYFYDNGQMLLERNGKYFGYTYNTDDLQGLIKDLETIIKDYNDNAENWYMMVE